MNFIHKKSFLKKRPLLDQDPPPQGLILQLPKLDHLVFHVRFDKQSCLFFAVNDSSILDIYRYI